MSIKPLGFLYYTCHNCNKAWYCTTGIQINQWITNHDPDWCPSHDISKRYLNRALAGDWATAERRDCEPGFEVEEGDDEEEDRKEEKGNGEEKDTKDTPSKNCAIVVPSQSKSRRWPYKIGSRRGQRRKERET